MSDMGLLHYFLEIKVHYVKKWNVYLPKRGILNIFSKSLVRLVAIL